METIKEKSKKGKGASRPQSQPALSSRQAAKLLRDRYLQQLDQRRPETDSAEAQATGQAEATGGWAADELTAHVPHSQNQHKRNFKDKSQIKRKSAERGTLRTSAHTAGGQQTARIKERTGVQHKVPVKERSIISDPVPVCTTQEEISQTSGPKQGHTASRAAKHNSGARPLSSASPLYGHTQAGTRDTATRPDNLLQRKQAIKQQRLGLSVSGEGRDSFAANPPRPGAGERGLRRCAGVGSPAPKIRSASYQKEASRPRDFSVLPKGKTVVFRPGRAIGHAQRQMTQQAVRQAQKTAKNTAILFKKAVVAVTKAASALVNFVAVLAGGSVLLMAMVVVILIAAVASSPFGLFFAEERGAPNTVSVAEAVASVNMAYNARLEELQTGYYDSVAVNGRAADWTEVLAVFAVKMAGADGGVDVATLDTDRVDRLNAVFWDMTTITTEVEIISHDDSDPNDDVDDSWTEYVLHITITARTADDMRTFYHFTDYQNSALDDLLADRAALVSLVESLSFTNADAQASRLVFYLPEGTKYFLNE